MAGQADHNIFFVPRKVSTWCSLLDLGARSGTPRGSSKKMPFLEDSQRGSLKRCVAHLSCASFLPSVLLVRPTPPQAVLYPKTTFFWDLRTALFSRGRGLDRVTSQEKAEFPSKMARKKT